MDPILPLLMIFTLVAIVITGGFILLIPLSRQLARFLALRMQNKIGIGEGVELELGRLRAAIEAVDQKLHIVSERQEFLEKILESRASDLTQLPR